MPSKKQRNILIIFSCAAALAGLIGAPLLFRQEATAVPTLDFNAITNESELEQYLHKNIVVSGIWRSSGVDGTYITNDSKTAAIYMRVLKNNGQERLKVLHFVHFDGQPVTLSGWLSKQPAQEQHYYFDVSYVKDYPSSILNIGWVQAQSTNIAQALSQHRSR